MSVVAKMMSDLRGIVGTKHRGGRDCNLKRFLDGLSVKDRKQMLEIIADGATAMTGIVAVLKRHGVNTSLSALRYHRRRECLSCFGGRNK